MTEDTYFEELSYCVKKANHSWRNRISIHTTRQSSSIESWDYIIDRRVSSFYRPYKQFINFTNKMIVAHSNMLSIYNMQAS